jgi:hypothetical protein
MEIIQVEELMKKPFSLVTKKECLNQEETLIRLGGLKDKFLQVAKQEEQLKDVFQTVVVFENDGKKQAINAHRIERILDAKEKVKFPIVDIRKNKEREGFILKCEIKNHLMGVRVEQVCEVMDVLLLEDFHKWKKKHLRESKNRLIFSMIE